MTTNTIIEAIWNRFKTLKVTTYWNTHELTYWKNWDRWLGGLGRWLSSGLQGSVLDNSSYNYDVGRAWPIDHQTYLRLKAWFDQQRTQPPRYTVLGNNCFEWALSAAQQVGIQLPVLGVRDKLWIAKTTQLNLLAIQLRIENNPQTRKAIQARIDRLRQFNPNVFPNIHFAYDIAASLRIVNTGVRLP